MEYRNLPEKLGDIAESIYFLEHKSVGSQPSHFYSSFTQKIDIQNFLTRQKLMPMHMVSLMEVNKPVWSYMLHLDLVFIII